MKIGVIANSDICLPLLYYLKRNQATVSLYFGAGLVDSGRASVPSFCASEKIAITTEEAPGQLYNWFKSFKPEIVFVAGYSSRIKVGKLTAVPGGIYNIHFGKLPEYRGANPVFWQLKNQEPVLGLTIHHVTEGLDAGAVVWKKEIPSEPHFTYAYVNKLFSNVMLEGVQFILQARLMGFPLPGKNQDETKAVTFPKPALQDVSINWATMDAAATAALVRSCSSWNIGAIAVFDGKEVKIMDAEPVLKPVSDAVRPGTIVSDADTLDVVCAGSTVVRIYALSLDGVYMPARHAAKVGFTAGQCFYHEFSEGAGAYVAEDQAAAQVHTCSA